mgnify:CR=1 FL=1
MVYQLTPGDFDFPMSQTYVSAIYQMNGWYHTESRPLSCHACQNCYHYRAGYCACREVVDMSNPCADWSPRG